MHIAYCITTLGADKICFLPSQLREQRICSLRELHRIMPQGQAAVVTVSIVASIIATYIMVQVTVNPSATPVGSPEPLASNDRVLAEAYPNDTLSDRLYLLNECFTDR